MYSDVFLDMFTADGSTIGMAVEIIPSEGDALRCHTGTGNVIIDGNTYYGVSTLGQIGLIPSVGDSNPAQTNLELSGIPSEFVSQCLNAKLSRAPCTIYAMVFNDDRVLQAAEVAMVGFVTDYHLVTGSGNKVQLSVSDEFEKYQMPISKYWTDTSHRLEHPDSALCQYASQNADREIYWGSKSDAPPMKSV